MAMLTLNGQIINVFDVAPYTDKKTGEISPAKTKVQIMAENVLQNGQNRMELVTLSVDTPDAYKALVGRSVRVPVGAFVSGTAIQFYALKGQKPQQTGAPATPAARGDAGAGATV